MQKISPCLWFNGQAEEAARFYTTVFNNAALGEIRRYGDAGPGPAGSVMTASFTLEGQEFIALNGGPEFTFSPAVSFFIRCETQDEVDRLWDALAEGGAPQQCGWVQDKFGLCWQVVPNALGEMLQDKDPVRAARVMQAMLGMIKLDIAGLRRAYDGQ